MAKTLDKAPEWPEDLTLGADGTVPSKRKKGKLRKTLEIADVQPSTILWLWYPYIAKGRVSLIEGDPGVGKSWFTLAIAAAVSTGGKLPGQDRAMPKGHVLLLSGEDGLSDTIAPRLMSFGADGHRISALAEHLTLDPNGIEDLEATIEANNATLVIIDPVQLYMGGAVDINRANEVRQFMEGLHIVAERTGCAIVIVRHMRKAGPGGKAIYAGLGSIDFSAAVRSVMQVERGENGMRYVTHIKCNIAPEGKVITYTIENKTIAWGALMDEAPHYRKDNRRSKNVKGFLADALKEGPKKSTEIEALAQAEGLTYQQISYAKEKLGIMSFRKDGVWWWAMDESPKRD